MDAILLRPDRALPNPLRQRGDLTLRELARRRHLHVARMGENFQQQTLLWLPRNYRRAAYPAPDIAATGSCLCSTIIG